jgi:hypothetical protein
LGATQLICTRDAKRTWGGCRQGAAGTQGRGAAQQGGPPAEGQRLLRCHARPASEAYQSHSSLAGDRHAGMLPGCSPYRGTAHRNRFSSCKSCRRAQSAEV